MFFEDSPDDPPGEAPAPVGSGGRHPVELDRRERAAFDRQREREKSGMGEHPGAVEDREALIAPVPHMQLEPVVEGHAEGFKHQRVEFFDIGGALEVLPADIAGADLLGFAGVAEELPDDPLRLFGQHASLHLRMPEYAGMPGDVESGAAAAHAGIGQSENDPPGAGVDQRARAHRAGLLGDVESDFIHAPVAGDGFDGVQQFDFGMADGGMAFFHPVPGGRQHPAVPDGYRSDRNFSGCGGIARLVEGEAHEGRIGVVHYFSMISTPVTKIP